MKGEKKTTCIILNTSLWWVLPTLFSVIVGSGEITVISPEKNQVVGKKSGEKCLFFAVIYFQAGFHP
jgi:hypothetical protein